MPEEREEIDENYRWSVDSVYGSIEEWESGREEVEELLEQAGSLKGDVTGSPENLLEALQLYEKIMRKVQKLSRYASMKSDEDTRIEKYQALKTRANSLSSRADEATSFIDPEIQELGEERLESFIEREEGLEKYRHHLDNLMRMKPHTRSPEVESVLADLGEVLDAPGEVYNLLANADLKFPEADGKEITLANFTKLQKNPEREFRKEVYEKFYDRFQELENTIGATFENSIRRDVKIAQLRNYETSREMAMHSSNIPVEVYDKLVDTVRNNLEPLHRHLDLKKEKLQVDDLRMWDVYMPLTREESPEVSFDEACEHVLKAVEPLGDDYRQTVEEGIESGWIDVYENKGKRAGAYSGGAYDTKPFILMNYQDDIDSMYTLAHELGHSMHSYYTRNNQPFIYSGYRIFVAEVASTVNEALLTRHLLENVEDEVFRRHVLSHALENLRGTLYRQTMFADFEHRMHREVEKGEALTPGKVSESYRELKEEFYQPVKLDERIEREWMKIPHFYWRYYVYQYSTGISAALSLYRDIIENGPGDYLEFLKAGSSVYPLKALQLAGVDMESPRPVREAVEVYSDYLDRIENLD